MSLVHKPVFKCFNNCFRSKNEVFRLHFWDYATDFYLEKILKQSKRGERIDIDLFLI